LFIIIVLFNNYNNKYPWYPNEYKLKTWVEYLTDFSRGIASAVCFVSSDLVVYCADMILRLQQRIIKPYILLLFK
jgi:hypothetical protein